MTDTIALTSRAADAAPSETPGYPIPDHVPAAISAEHPDAAAVVARRASRGGVRVVDRPDRHRWSLSALAVLTAAFGAVGAATIAADHPSVAPPATIATTVPATSAAPPAPRTCMTMVNTWPFVAPPCALPRPGGARHVMGPIRD